MRITPRPVEVRHEGAWRSGTLRSWEIDDTTGDASGIVTFDNDRHELVTGRFPGSLIRDPN